MKQLQKVTLRLVQSLLVCSMFLILSCEGDDNYTQIEEQEEMMDDDMGNDNPDDDDMDADSSLVIDIDNTPFDTLAEYGFFQGDMANLNPVNGVLEYSLINKLFSDYSIKKRFVWMPEGVTGVFDGDDSLLDMPVGTILIKNFFYDNVLPDNTRRILETRLLIHKEDGWEFADYIWNEDQTAAVYDLDGSTVPITWELNGEVRSVDYRIPNSSECQTCHKTGDTSIPIGPKPQNLNMTYTYGDGTTANQLGRWVETGYLASAPTNVQALISWTDETASVENRVRGYFEINCAHCHIAEGHCSYRPVRLNYTLSNDPENIGVCVVPDEDLGNGLTHIISPGNTGRSTLFFRLNTTAEEVRMPLLGRTLIHDEAIDLIETYINQLTEICD